MDPLSQGLVGAVVAQAFAKKEHTRTAALAGAVAGMAPDLDVLIRSSHDPMMSIYYHRHFTHALAFIPFGGLIVAAFLWLFARQKMAFKHLAVFCILGFGTHGLLDACTSYGTVLYWPFSDDRVAWNIISIIDPIFTLGILLLFTITSCIKRSAKWAIAGCVLGLSYLSIGFVQHQTIHNLTLELAAKKNHETDHIFVSPSIGNLLVWRSVYVSNGIMHMQEAYSMPFGQRWITGSFTVKQYNAKTDFPSIGNSVQRDDVMFFATFSDQLIGPYSDNPNVIADYRYSLSSGEAAPLWGIELKPNEVEAHVSRVNFGQNREERIDDLLESLGGTPPSRPAIHYK